MDFDYETGDGQSSEKKDLVWFKLLVWTNHVILNIICAMYNVFYTAISICVEYIKVHV